MLIYLCLILYETLDIVKKIVDLSSSGPFGNIKFEYSERFPERVDRQVANVFTILTEISDITFQYCQSLLRTI